MKHGRFAALILGFAAVCLAALPATARAQVAPYAMFSAGHYSGIGVGPGTTSTETGGITSLGGTFGVYDDTIKAGPARLGPDVRLMVQNSANSTPYGNKLLGVLLGGRVDLAGVPLPVNPYFQLEIGGVGTNNGTSYNRSASFAYQVQFGGDFPIFPHVAGRLEYGTGQLTSLGNTNHTLQTFGAGVVVRLF